MAVERETAGSEFAGSPEAWAKGNCVTSVLFKVRVKLQSVLDLSDPAILRQLKLTNAQVRGAWEGYQALFKKEPVTWVLGRAVHATQKFDGILYPSTKHGTGRCLLIFTGRLKEGVSEVVLLDDNGNILERLPGNGIFVG